MKILLKTSLLLTLLSPALTMAATPPKPFELPQVVTTTGAKFVARCSDEDFNRASNPRILAIRCQELLTLWQYEASWRQQASLAVGKPGDPIMPNPGIPAFNAIRGIPAYPSAR